MRISDWSSDVCSSDLAQPFYLHGMPPGSSSNRSWCNLGVTDPPCSRHAVWVGESQAHKPLPFRGGVGVGAIGLAQGSEEHSSELQSLMRISYAVFCL